MKWEFPKIRGTFKGFLGLGFRVWGLGFRGLGFGGLGFLGIRVFWVLVLFKCNGSLSPKAPTSDEAYTERRRQGSRV